MRADPRQSVDKRGFRAFEVQDSTNPRASAFDVLQADGVELINLPYRERRRRLEVLFASRALTPPWTLCPMTTDVTVAREWLESWTEVTGVEGLVPEVQ
ncbi:hypothetical protein [Streptomyces sp. NPDC058401]|uniref:ATP-dependent DNA ligase n=1 Tax=Streptomyces sp. NPDC058401 TaxID=3346480 RepID=UPI00365F52B8